MDRRGAVLAGMLAGVLAALLAGCGAAGTTAATSANAGPSTSAGASTKPSASTSPSPSTMSESTSTITGLADVVATALAPAPTRPAVLTSIRTAPHGSFDRVVLEFDGPVDGYTVRYVDALTMDPTGTPVAHTGAAALQVTVQQATLDTTPLVAQGETPRTYPGPRRFSPNLPSVKDVVQAGDFEATLTFGIGVGAGGGAKKAFGVLLLSDPTRLVVDVAH